MKTIKRKNGTVYREKIYVEGKQIAKIFKRKSDAIAWKVKMLSMRNAEELNLKHFEDVPFDAFAKKWLKEKVLNYRSASTYENYESYLRRHFIPHFGGLGLNKIQIQHIHSYVISLKEKGHNPTGTNLILRCLRTLFNAAVDEDFLQTNPMRRFKNLKEDLREEIYMSKMEIVQFLRANAIDPLYPLYIVALNSGMRRGELCGLRWDRINFPHSQIEVGSTRDKRGHRATTKSGKRRTVPMNDQVKSLLKDLFLKRSSDYVFVDESVHPVDPHHLYRDFAKAQQRAGLQRHYRFHDLRHTFASHFMMNGGNLYDLQKILGHSQIEMTMRYAHLSPDHLAQAINVVNFGEEEKSEVINLFTHQRATSA